jgi:hypothetical protein
MLYHDYSLTLRLAITAAAPRTTTVTLTLVFTFGGLALQISFPVLPGGRIVRLVAKSALFWLLFSKKSNKRNM